MNWIHDISQSALAGAVAILGLVIMLELRSILRLRRLLDGHLARVFEQLDLLRFENQQLLEAQQGGRGPATPRPESRVAATPPARLVASGRRTEAAPQPARTDATERASLPTGEARLLASLAAARALRERSAAAQSRPGT